MRPYQLQAPAPRSLRSASSFQSIIESSKVNEHGLAALVARPQAQGLPKSPPPALLCSLLDSALTPWRVGQVQGWAPGGSGAEVGSGPGKAMAIRTQEEMCECPRQG